MEMVFSFLLPFVTGEPKGVYSLRSGLNEPAPGHADLAPVPGELLTGAEGCPVRPKPRCRSAVRLLGGAAPPCPAGRWGWRPFPSVRTTTSSRSSGGDAEGAVSPPLLPRSFL